MPYIEQKRRDALDPMWDTPNNAGELNYVITKLLLKYIDVHSPLSYQLINDVLGALEGAKQEFYARIARPYEDQKILSNGDVYT